MSVSINQIGRALFWLALLSALAVVGDWLLTTHFMVYDDEGYVLWSLRNYVADGALYTKVYSQYGPFFYVAYDAWHRLTGWAFTNDNARWITLVFWLATAGLAGTIAAELTRNWLARASAMLLTFAALSVMCSEPGHPGGPIALLSALGTWWGVISLHRDYSSRRFMVGTAVVGGALLLMKINVGVFFFIAAASWVALHTRGLPERALAWLVALGGVASPPLLMRAQLAEPGFAQFGLVFACGAAALVLVWQSSARGKVHEVREWVWLGGTAAGFVALVCGLVIARGTTWSDLLDGAVLAPLNQPLAYSFPPQSHPAASVLALAGLMAAAVLLRATPWSQTTRRVIAGVRLGALMALAWWGRAAIEHTTGAFLFHFGISLAWVFAVPLRSGEAAAARARLWLAWIFTWQTLHAFPVAGSQIGWGALLAAPLFAIGAWEAVEELMQARPLLGRVLPMAILGLAACPAANLARSGWLYRHHSTPLALPGAERLRLPVHLSLGMRALVRNVQLHGDTLFSHPGMFSFNLWSGHPTPTAANVTVWSTLLSEPRQDAIRRRLEADERAVIIGQQFVLTHLIAHGFAPHGRLNDYLVDSFVPGFRLETYVFWIKRGRTIAPVGTARRLGATELELITDRTARAARWEIWSYGVPRRLLAGDIGANAREESIDPQGNLHVNGTLRRISWTIPAVTLPRADDMALRVIDDAGREMEFVPFRN